MRIWLQVSIIVATTLSTPYMFILIMYLGSACRKGRKDTRVILRTDGRMYGV